MELVEQHASFGGRQEVWAHRSGVLGCDMKFSVYLPAVKAVASLADATPLPQSETRPHPKALKPMSARMAAPTIRAAARTMYGAYLGSWPLVSAERLLRTGVSVEVI